MSLLDQLKARPLAAILLVALLGWVPAAAMLPPLDRDESRFAEASRQMVESGNYVDIRFANVPRYNKPIGIYWLQAAVASVSTPSLRSRIWVYRLPSLLGGFLSLLLLYGMARSTAPPKMALLGALLLGTGLLLTAESDIATTDAALLAAVIAAEAALMRVYLAARGHPGPPLALILGGWVALAFGVLLKGPVILAVLGVTSLGLSLWDRDWRWLGGTKPLMGTVLAVILVAPWALAIGLASHGAFYRQSLGHDFAAKILGGEESHGAPPGYYFVLVNLTFWPATLLLLPAIRFAALRRKEALYRFLLAWSGGAWLLFELVPTKLPHYILPAYPALAFLVALWVSSPRNASDSRWERALRFVASVQFGLVAVAIALACIVLPAHYGGSASWPLFAGVALGLAAACVAIVLFVRRRAEPAALLAMGTALTFYLVLAFEVVPQLHDLWLSRRAADLVAAHRGASRNPVVLAGYVEPSLVFLLGSDTQIEPPGAAARAAAAHGGLALVEERVQPRFLSALQQTGATATSLGSVSGLDYSTGREQHITLYRVTRPSSDRPA
ncbi:MAG TPA: glycosyltransferase family 39 protein [Rhizomicrobium sp.]|nr:glycosyltransferase family 39 protein [Rhizomicrobium sp.]